MSTISYIFSRIPPLFSPQKLGKKAFLQKTLVLNPKIGPIGKNLLLKMSKTGKELALDGGKNLLRIHRVYVKMTGNYKLLGANAVINFR